MPTTRDINTSADANEITGSDSIFISKNNTTLEKIDYDLLADAILSKITSKNYTVAGASQTLISAINAVDTALDDKVDVIDGKGLSTNDYTTIDMNKLAGINAGAQANVIESISVNGTAQSIVGKNVNLTVPTDNSQLSNGAGYQTADQVSAAVQNKVDKVAGKGLSTNDYTTEEKNQLSNLVSIIVMPNSGSHNSIFRGKYLGNSYTTAQKEAITSGTFDDLYIGDYWTISGIDYVICHFDYYYRCSDSDVNYHHVVVMPRGVMTGLSVTKINSESDGYYQWCSGTSHSTADGYIGSRMRTVIMPACDVKVKAAFGSSNVHAISELYPNAFASTTDGRATSWAWTITDLVCDLCNETMVYGHQVWGKGSTFGHEGYEVGIDKWQLAIFGLYPSFANMRFTWWLRSVTSAPTAAHVNNTGNATNTGAAHALGVRPRFLVS